MCLENQLIKDFNKGIKVSTPLFSINCFDPEMLLKNLSEKLVPIINDFGSKERPMIQWDCVRGWQARNKSAIEAIGMALNGAELEDTFNPVSSLKLAQNLPEGSILFLLNGHLYFKDDFSFLQAFWNLRDTFKATNRACVILTNSFILPLEIQNDVLILDEKLPDEEDLRNIIKELAEENEIKLSEEDIEKGVVALKGLSAFPAEQSVALSLGKSGLDIENLWSRKIQKINETPGLSVHKDGAKFENLGGLEEIKNRFSRIIKGKKSPKVIVWIDEIEKAMAGAGTESSGTTMDQLGVLLNEFVEKDYSGSVFVGVPGAAKSALAKAIGNEAEVITIKLDLGEMKGQFVGLSEERIRTGMKVIEAVGGFGGAFFVATSNDISSIKPELLRRFKKGVWFFDLPTREEREVIWKIYLKKYEFDINLVKSIRFDEGWTGAEIENCCMTAWEEEISIEEASKSIIPVSVSGKEQVERLRNEANGKYSSTNYAGVYNSSMNDVKFIQPKRRIATD